MEHTIASPPLHARGAEEARPSLKSWAGVKEIATRVKDEISADNVSVVSAGVAFFAFLSVFPGLAAIISIYGLVTDPAEAEAQISRALAVIPPQAADLLSQQLQDLAASSAGALTFGVVAGVLAAIWSANKGMKTLIKALNIVYDEKEDRPFLKQNAFSLLLTMGAVLFTLIALFLIVALSPILDWVGLGQQAQTLLNFFRWPILAAFVLVGISVMYRYGPCRSRHRPGWRWPLVGAAIATALWIVVSLLFSYYTSNFGNYNETYGSVGAVVALLMWLYLSAFVVLVGGEVESVIERFRAERKRKLPELH